MRFSPELCADLVESTAAGLSLPDACRAAGVRLPTVKGWLTRGRREESGPYSAFAADLGAARERAASVEVAMDEGELFVVVSRAARRGSVQAMKLRWEMLCAARNADEAAESEKSSDPLTGLDQLAERRAA